MEKIDWVKIRADATAFSNKWRHAYYEKGQAQFFVEALFKVFGVDITSGHFVEYRTKLADGTTGFMDCFYPGRILIEMKSLGGDLDKAYEQASAYAAAVDKACRPKCIVVCDFQHFRFYDLLADPAPIVTSFRLADFRRYVKLFGPILDLPSEPVAEQSPVNRKAAEAMGALHNLLVKGVPCGQHEMETYLVRLLFCLFAEDAGIFEPHQFTDFLKKYVASDLAAKLAELFQALDTPGEKRSPELDANIRTFRYVDGGLFREHLGIPAFSVAMRDTLLKCAAEDWSKISPAVFGSMFQSIMDPAARHDLGAHYTSEENILKVARPVLLEELREELDKKLTLFGPSRKKCLQEFVGRLASLAVLDPACGCGNFLIIVYRELRAMEADAIEAIHKDDPSLDVKSLFKVSISQFYGIELEPFPVAIARTALWLMEHLCNTECGARFGLDLSQFPIADSGHILEHDALNVGWQEAFGLAKPFDVILGNPPFQGARVMSKEQKAEVVSVFGEFPGVGDLDFVTAWYKLAADYVRKNAATRAAFVSTNSITQGEQVAALWPRLGVTIDFAHRTFTWANAAKGVAGVYCVIIGFSKNGRPDKAIYEGDVPTKVSHINGYLVDAPDVYIESRMTPLCDVPEIGIGNKPIDDGNYLFTEEEKAAFIAKEPASAKWFRPFLGAEEFLHGEHRYCLWLGDCSAHELKAMPECLKRVEAVRTFRLASHSAGTRKLAGTPTRFHVENMPDGNYILIPRHSSERRDYIPFGFVSGETLAGDSTLIIPGATLYHFAVLESLPHMAWMKAVCGRLESRYRYSKEIVYNTFVWPKVTDEQKAAIAAAGKAILDARAAAKDATLADLYDKGTFAQTPGLMKAHEKVDKLVLQAYGLAPSSSEVAIVTHLMSLYAMAVKSAKD